MQYHFIKNEEKEPCFKCSHIDDVIPIVNALVLAMYINDDPGYVTANDEHGNYVHMATTSDVPEIYSSMVP